MQSYNKDIDTPILLTSIIITKEQIKKIIEKMNKKIKNYDNINIDIYI